VPNLTRRRGARLKASPELADDLAEIRRRTTGQVTDTHANEVALTGVTV
jgi:hypothetical protein